VFFFAGQRDRESWTQGVPPDTHDHIQFRTALAKTVAHICQFHRQCHLAANLIAIHSPESKCRGLSGDFVR
jgi:hypothetical protein